MLFVILEEKKEDGTDRLTHAAKSSYLKYNLFKLKFCVLQHNKNYMSRFRNSVSSLP